MVCVALLMNGLNLISQIRRKQHVSMNAYSNFADVKRGVPQGSVLCLLLFLIYINDLKHA